MTHSDKATDDMNAQEIQNLIEENQRLQRENENLKATRMGVYQREKRLEEAEEKVKTLTEELEREKKRYGDAVAKFYEENVVITKYWFVDEETNEKLYDTDEMESAFHDAMVDLGAYNDELRCEGCDKRFGKTESSFQNAEGLAVCVDCLTSEESGEE